MNAIMRLHRAQAGYLAAQGSGSKYIKFADPAVEAVLMAKGVSSDGIGITVADAEKVTSIGTWFKGNTEITSFDEFEKFTGVTKVASQSFQDCTSLVSIKVPCDIDNGPNAGTAPFLNCTSLVSVYLGEKVKVVGNHAFRKCSSLSEINLEKIETLGRSALFGCTLFAKDVIIPKLQGSLYGTFSGTNVGRILDLGQITSIQGTWGEPFCGSNAKVIILPSSLATAGQLALVGVKPDCLVIKASTPPAFGNNLFYQATLPTYIYVPDASVASYQGATGWTTYSTKYRGISNLATDNPTLYNEIKDYL